MTALGFLAIQNSHGQQRSFFFRISSPYNTRITSFGSDGTMTWTNVTKQGVTCTVQRAARLSGVSNWTDYVSQIVTNVTLSLRVADRAPSEGMALIPAGMNAGADPDKGAYVLTTEAYSIDVYEVTKAKWGQVYGWAVENGYGFDHAGSGKASNHPVQQVNWFDCVKWCNARSQKEGRAPAYYSDASLTHVYKTGQVLDPYIDTAANGYRLPTGVQWEKAARGGQSGNRFPWGNTINHSNANYYAGNAQIYDTSGYTVMTFHPSYSTGSFPYTSPVGSFAPNGYGLYDMTGNVWEWVFEWYPGYVGSRRMLLGGSWDASAYGNRVSYGANSAPSNVNLNNGFRTVLPSR